MQPNSNKPFIICLLGPTASGKTNLAYELVNHFPCDIISVDSAMVYRGMDIGTNKPTQQELKQYPHKLIDIRDPLDAYSAGDFIKDANLEINQSLANKRTPLLVGGTMMYFNALINGMANLPEANPAIREEILNDAKKEGWMNMHSRLKSIDQKSYHSIKPTDGQRISRALEVYYSAKKPISEFETIKPEYTFDIHCFGLFPQDRKALHAAIGARFELMLKLGLVEEVKMLYNRGDLNIELPSIRSVGYRQVWQYFDNQLTLDEMQEKVIVATRQLAKRQLTWLRSWQDITLLDETVKPFEKISEWLSSLQ